MRYKKRKPLLLPEYMFESFSDVTPSFLESIGVRALVIDIDNTLAPYEQDEPDDMCHQHDGNPDDELHVLGLMAYQLHPDQTPQAAADGTCRQQMPLGDPPLLFDGFALIS